MFTIDELQAVADWLADGNDPQRIPRFKLGKPKATPKQKKHNYGHKDGAPSDGAWMGSIDPPRSGR